MADSNGTTTKKRSSFQGWARRWVANHVTGRTTLETSNAQMTQASTTEGATMANATETATTAAHAAAGEHWWEHMLHTHAPKLHGYYLLVEAFILDLFTFFGLKILFDRLKAKTTKRVESNRRHVFGRVLLEMERGWVKERLICRDLSCGKPHEVPASDAFFVFPFARDKKMHITLDGLPDHIVCRTVVEKFELALGVDTFPYLGIMEQFADEEAKAKAAAKNINEWLAEAAAGNAPMIEDNAVYLLGKYLDEDDNSDHRRAKVLYTTVGTKSKQGFWNHMGVLDKNTAEQYLKVYWEVVSEFFVKEVRPRWKRAGVITLILMVSAIPLYWSFKYLYLFGILPMEVVWALRMVLAGGLMFYLGLNPLTLIVGFAIACLVVGIGVALAYLVFGKKFFNYPVALAVILLIIAAFYIDLPTQSDPELARKLGYLMCTVPLFFFLGNGKLSAWGRGVVAVIVLFATILYCGGREAVSNELHSELPTVKAWALAMLSPPPSATPATSEKVASTDTTLHCANGKNDVQMLPLIGRGMIVVPPLGDCPSSWAGRPANAPKFLFDNQEDVVAELKFVDGTTDGGMLHTPSEVAHVTKRPIQVRFWNRGEKPLFIPVTLL